MKHNNPEDRIRRKTKGAGKPTPFGKVPVNLLFEQLCST